MVPERFGMPLDPDDESLRAARHLDPFHHAVGTVGGHDEVSPELLDRLVVEAVHRDLLRSQDLPKSSLGQDLHVMAGLPSLDVGIVRTRAWYLRRDVLE